MEEYGRIRIHLDLGLCPPFGAAILTQSEHMVV